MARDRFPSSPSDPEYVAAVVGVLAAGALFAYSALSSAAPAADTIALVLLWVCVPAGLAHELARRYW